MKSVYLVYGDDLGIDDLRGVFTTLDKAKQFIQCYKAEGSNRERVYIDQWKLDTDDSTGSAVRRRIPIDGGKS